MYTIKEVCQLLDMSEHTIRYYTDENIVPVQRDENNYRIFDERAIDWLRGAKYLRGLGMSLSSIKAYHELCMQAGDEAIAKRLDILEKQLIIAKNELIESQKRVDYLLHEIDKSEKIKNHVIPDAQNPSKKKYK